MQLSELTCVYFLVLILLSSSIKHNHALHKSCLTCDCTRISRPEFRDDGFIFLRRSLLVFSHNMNIYDVYRVITVHIMSVAMDMIL